MPTNDQERGQLRPAASFNGSNLEELAERLGIPRGEYRDRLINEMQLVLELHEVTRAGGDKEPRTPRQILDCIEPLLRDYRSLAERIRKLHPAIRFELRPPGESCIADNELARIECAMSAAVQLYEDMIVPHRQANHALRITVQRLQTIFAQFSAKNLSSRVRQEKEREFIHEALQFAGIKHPDPDENRTRFNSLLTQAKNSHKARRKR